MSSVTDSQISSVAHPVLCELDVKHLLSTGCSEKLILELLQYNKSAYQAYVSVLHAVTNPGGSYRSAASGVRSSRSSLLSSSTGPLRVAPVLKRNLSPGLVKPKGFGSASLGVGRAFSFDSVPCASVSDVQGYCYKKLFRQSRVEAVSSVLGPWPTLDTVLSLPARDFRAMSAIGSLSLYRSGNDYHLDSSAMGAGGLPVLDVMRTLASVGRFPSASMGREMHGLPGTLLDNCGVELSDRVGGIGYRLLLLEVKSECVDDVLRAYSDFGPVWFGNTVFMTKFGSSQGVAKDSWFLRGFKKWLLLPAQPGLVKIGSKVIGSVDVYLTLSDFAKGYNVDVVPTDFGAVGLEAYAVKGRTFGDVAGLQDSLHWPELQRTECTAYIVRE